MLMNTRHDHLYFHHHIIMNQLESHLHKVLNMLHLLLVRPIHRMYMPEHMLHKLLIKRHIQMNSWHKHCQGNKHHSLTNYINNINYWYEVWLELMSYKLYMSKHQYKLNNMKDKVDKGLTSLHKKKNFYMLMK